VVSLQDQNFEHQNVIVGRSAALRPIAPGRGALKIGSKDLKIDDLIEPLKIVALRGNVLQTFVDIKKSRVSDHPTIPSETRKGNHKSTLTAAVFGGVQFIEVETFEYHPSVVTRAVELLGKEIGMFKERRETKIALSDEELDAELRRLQAELDLSTPSDKKGKPDA
jgi:hypothetical protein